MMEKRITNSSKVEMLSNTPKNDFKIGTRFIFNGAEWMVIESKKADNTEMRRIVCGGEDTFITLQSLHKDMETPGFRFTGEANNEEKPTNNI